MLGKYKFFFNAMIICAGLYTGKTYAQGLDFLPAVKVDSGAKATGAFILNTVDFHKVDKGGVSEYANSIQIIDAAQPWPPVWFTSAAPCGFDKEHGNFVFNWFMDVSEEAGYVSFYKELSVLNPELDWTQKKSLMSGYIVCDAAFNSVDTFKSAVMPVNFHAFSVNTKREKLGMLQLDTVLNMSAEWHSVGDSADKTLVDMIEIVDSNNKVIFKWNPIMVMGVGAVDPKYAHEPSASVAPGILDWSHGNSISWDFDGNILYCFRHIGVGKISRADGHVIWHLDGKKIYRDKNGDTIAFYLQHDFKKVRKDGNSIIYSLYSNGDKEHPVPFVLRFSVKGKTQAVSLIEKKFAVRKFRSTGSGNYDIDDTGNYLFSYGVTSSDSVSAYHSFLEYGNNKFGLTAKYLLPKDVYSYKVHRFTGPVPRRPVIIGSDGVLKVDGNMQSYVWYQLAGYEHTVAVKVGEGSEYKPMHDGIYCVAATYGIGYSVSKPVVFLK